MTNDWGNLLGTAVGLAIVYKVVDEGILNRKKRKARKSQSNSFFGDGKWV